MFTRRNLLQLFPALSTLGLIPSLWSKVALAADAIVVPQNQRLTPEDLKQLQSRLHSMTATVRMLSDHVSDTVNAINSGSNQIAAGAAGTDNRPAIDSALVVQTRPNFLDPHPEDVLNSSQPQYSTLKQDDGTNTRTPFSSPSFPSLGTFEDWSEEDAAERQNSDVGFWQEISD